MKREIYRTTCKSEGLVNFTVKVEESDLLVMAGKNLKKEAEYELNRQRKLLKRYIEKNPEFYRSFSPVSAENVHPIIELMSQSSFLTNTGPMASVAGAIAEMVGKKLLEFSPQVIVENGGDIFLKTNNECIVGMFAGNSPFSMKTGIKIPPSEFPKGIATSSGKIGHSFSYGDADAVTIVSNSAAFSDGAATYFGNMVVEKKINSKEIVNEIKNFPFIEGCVIIKEKELFIWGKIELVRL